MTPDLKRELAKRQPGGEREQQMRETKRPYTHPPDWGWLQVDFSHIAKPKRVT